MKKLFLALLVFAVVCGAVFADFDILSYPSSIEGGDIQIDLGLGYAGWGSYSGWKMKLPPIVLTGEYCLPVGVPISVGGMFSVARYGWDWSDYSYSNAHKITYTYLIFAARGNWHWGFDINWLDLYTGLSFGYRHFSWSYDGPDKAYFDRYYSGWSYGGFYFGTQVGAHFYFTKFLGAAVEVGWPIYIKGAVALKF